jgi:ribosome-binding protein aMBF1 (putative translation factor)
MSLTDRLNRANQDRLTGSLAEPTEYNWERKQTSPFTRATGSLSLSGEHEIETLARELALSKPDLAAAIGLNAAMVDRWLRGLVRPSGVTADRFEQLRSIHTRLYAIFQPYQALDWLRTANAELGFSTPSDALLVGQISRVEKALDELESRTG